MMTYINTLGRVSMKALEGGFRVIDYDIAARKNWESMSSLDFPGKNRFAGYTRSSLFL